MIENSSKEENSWRIDPKKKRKCNGPVFAGPFASIHKSYPSESSDGKVSLVILNQPERQHRARYQTEGSRGAVKDRDGHGFPKIQLRGYDGPAILQVYIGSDQGEPGKPHVYYQTCKVAGKTCTPCKEYYQEGTDILLLDMEPEKDYVVSCDCVGILKERYSDIELNTPNRKMMKKKATNCRMVFRVEIEIGDVIETLQVISEPISCLQQPGTPEILKISTQTSSYSGGGELWMIGKNFLKNARVIFQDSEVWAQSVNPDKDFFNNSHLIVTIPRYGGTINTVPIDISVSVVCGLKTSDPFPFRYLPEETECSPIRRLTILEPVDNRRETNIDYCEDTIFDPVSYRSKREELHEDSTLTNGLDDDTTTTTNLTVNLTTTTTTTMTTTTTSTNTTSTTTTSTTTNQDDSITFSNFFKRQAIASTTSTTTSTAESNVVILPSISSDTLKVAQKELLAKEQDFNSTNSIYIQGTESDNATISIKLPNSIISNSEKFENVMNTINKTLLQPDPSLKSIDSNLAKVGITSQERLSNWAPPIDSWTNTTKSTPTLMDTCSFFEDVKGATSATTEAWKVPPAANEWTTTPTEAAVIAATSWTTEVKTTITPTTPTAATAATEVTWTENGKDSLWNPDNNKSVPYLASGTEMIDPKRVLYDTTPMEVDGMTKTFVKGNPLLSESSGIIKQQQKIENATIIDQSQQEFPTTFPASGEVMFPPLFPSSNSDQK